MATLVLTAVGSAIGGPVGGAIGAIIGQQIDAAIFAPKLRQGPRLKELEVQTSSYGSQIPAIFGSMRVAGTVIWATDLVERRAKSGGGKGKPATINYSYSVSMAVALSSRPIARIGRIWADGNLLRGSAGDLKVDAQLRIYTGEDDQPLDPLIASAETAGQASAHRGLAYAMFEDLQLAEYGNRIPSLTFEIFEREGYVPVSAIFEAATAREVQATTSQNIQGFALSGLSASEPLGTLLDILPIEVVAHDGRLIARDPLSDPTNAISIVPISQEGQEAFDLPRQSLEPATLLPHIMTLRYYDSDREFQASLQRSERGPVSRKIVQIELPAVLNAADASQIVGNRHLRSLYDRKRWRGDVALNEFKLSPGDLIKDENGLGWRIEKVEHRSGSCAISARAVIENSVLTATSATPGRSQPAPDLAVGETRIALIELPVFGTDDPAKPVFAVFAAGTQSGWRRAALSLSVGDALTEIGSTASPAIIGVLLDPLAPHHVNLIDESNGLRVQLLNSAMTIAERTGSPLDADAPYVWLDGEFLRFGNCRLLGNGVFQLSRLRRGCFQSEGAVLVHPIGSRFVLMEADSARLLGESAFGMGETVTLEALGIADVAPVSDTITIRALTTKPLTPVHGSFKRLSDGSVTLQWVRRSRIDDGWRDGVDQMMAEPQEQYLVSLSADGISFGTWTASAASKIFSASEWGSFGISPTSIVTAQILQVGRHAQSEPLLINLT